MIEKNFGINTEDYMIGPANLLLFVLYSLLIPFLIGLLWTQKWIEYEKSAAMAMVCGFLTMLAVFELLAVPMIILKVSFSYLVGCWKIIIWVSAVASLIINMKRLPLLMRTIFSKLKMHTMELNLLWIAVILLIIFQTYMLVGHMRTDTDDARFVAEAMEAYELDTMLQYHPITGEFLGEPIGEMKKDIASPFPIFMALAGSLFKLPPAIAVHVFFPLWFIPLAYVFYYLIGRYLLPNDEKYIALFMFFLCLLHCFAYESIYAAGYNLLSIIWQGRAVLATMIIPFVWFILMHMINESKLIGRLYGVLFIGIIAGVLTSSMSVILFPILIGSYALIIGVNSKSLFSFMKTMLFIIPCLIVYVVYMYS